MPAAGLQIGWRLRYRGAVHTPALLSEPEAGEVLSLLRQPSAEGPPTWRAFLGVIAGGAKARLFTQPTAAESRQPV
jgi:hypothetical protein